MYIFTEFPIFSWEKSLIPTMTWRDIPRLNSTPREILQLVFEDLIRSQSPNQVSMWIHIITIYIYLNCDLCSSLGKEGTSYNAMLMLNVALTLNFILVPTCDFHTTKIFTINNRLQSSDPCNDRKKIDPISYSICYPKW